MYQYVMFTTSVLTIDTPETPAHGGFTRSTQGPFLLCTCVRCALARAAVACLRALLRAPLGTGGTGSFQVGLFWLCTFFFGQLLQHFLRCTLWKTGVGPVLLLLC